MNAAQPRAGLLPLYLKLYDDAMPEVRANFEPLLADVVAGLEQRGIAVTSSPVCRVRDEFAQAVHKFEADSVDLIITLHLAYSPSLESADALARTATPILMLDTTLDDSFGRDVDPARLMYNHGVHGVQDLANVLRRRGKSVEIVAGHYAHSNVLDRAAGHVRAARAARRLRSSRALRIGEPFPGMGDFAVEDRTLRRALGIRVDSLGLDSIESSMDSVLPEEIDAEVLRDRERFDVSARDEVHRRSVHIGLALRRLLESEAYTAFSMNFLAFDSATRPAGTVPFLEASKAMSRGIGYAGEGDVLTASLVGALQSAFGMTTFTEIFCPDWQGQSLFVSHMGEVNPDVAASRPLVFEKDFPWTGASSPAVLSCCIQSGPAVLVNLAPGPDDAFSLIAAPMTVMEDGTHPGMRETIRGWIRPASGVADFLERYSLLGGTHHKALVLGDRLESIQAFARYAGLEGHTIV